LTLVNDSVSPGANYYYGTNSSGTKGFFSLTAEGVNSITGTTGQVLANGNAGTSEVGAVTLTLATALVSINSVTSVAGQNLVLATGTSGTAVTITSATNVVTLASTTASTSSTTGALVVSGGVGIAGNVVSGGGQGWGVTSTATAADTTTLTAASTTVQIFTGTTTQTCQLPAANALGSGIALVYVIVNRSTGAVSVARAGSDTIEGGTSYSLAAGSRIVLVSDGVSAWSVV